MVALAKAVMFLAALAVLFALVCPLAVTPMPVGAVKRIADAVGPFAAPLLIIAANLSARHSALLLVPPEPVTVDVADLSCVCKR